MKDIENLAALVTGGSRGIGRAIALKLARAGARIALNYRSSDDAARATYAEIEALGGRAIVVRADVTIAAEVSRLANSVTDALGRVDILVNNAGVARVQSLDEVKEQDWDEVLSANLKSVFLVTQAFLPGFAAQAAISA